MATVNVEPGRFPRLQAVAEALTDAGHWAVAMLGQEPCRVRVTVGDSAAVFLTWDAQGGWAWTAWRLDGPDAGRGEVAVDPGAPAEDVVAAVLPVLDEVRKVVTR